MKQLENSLRKRYEAPKSEIIDIEPQGMLCVSGGEEPATSSFTGDGGVQFETDGGTW